MKVCIAGGGRVGRYLAQNLLANRHKVVIIEPVEAQCRMLADTLDISVICGNSISTDTLRTADVAGAEAEPVLPLAAVSQPASRQRASAAQSSSETNRFWIMADSSFYQCPARRRGSILGLTSSILFSPAVVNRRSWDEFQLRLTFKAEAVIIGTERESNKNPTDIKPRSIV